MGADQKDGQKTNQKPDPIADQLSWEALLSGQKKNDGAPAASADLDLELALANAEASAPFAEPSFDEPAARPSPAKAPSKRRSRAKAATPAPAPEGGEPRLSEMNWGALDFGKSETKPAAKAEVPSVRLPIAPFERPAKPAAASSPPTARDLFGRGKSAAVAKPAREIQTPAEDAPEAMTVSELNRSIKDILEGKFPLLWLRGEISNFKAHTSGHFYFSLKDSKAQISAVMFRGFNSGLRFRPEDGMEVVVRGKVTVYEPRGNYQIFCEAMEPVGAGALQKAFEQLKAKLQAEGLFEQARKRALPALPRHIAIVTSPTGAAIRDMLNVLGRRFKGARITIVPAKVQGDAAPREIVAAIELVNRLDDVDVMIVGRGGGSIEDLWAFNEELVARAIASARVPTISAVGHEIDFTIADFVADLRAPTPSAAAELVIKNAADLAAQVNGLERAFKLAWLRKLAALQQRAESVARRLVDPQRRLQDMTIRCDELVQRLENGAIRAMQDLRMRVALLREKIGDPGARVSAERRAVAGLETRLRLGAKAGLDRKRQAWARGGALLDSLSPLKVVERGYSIVTAASSGSVIKDVAQIRPGEEIAVRFARGRAVARIERIETS